MNRKTFRCEETVLNLKGEESEVRSEHARKGQVRDSVLSLLIDGY